MNQELEKYELIDRYLRNQLSGEERISFENKLVSDAEFAEIVEAQKVANELILDEQMIRLKDRMKTDLQKTGIFTWSKIVLNSTLLLIAGGSIYFFVTRDSQTEKEQHKLVVENKVIAEDTEKISSSQSVDNTQKENKSLKQSGELKNIIEKNTSPVIEIKSKDIEDNINVFSNSEVGEVLNKEKEQTSVNLTPAKNNECEEVVINATLSVTNSCNDNPTGAISIDPETIHGGVAPYTYSLNGKDFTTIPSFKNLREGAYELKIRDGKRCITTIHSLVKAIDCKETIDDKFYPSHGEKWKFPLNESEDARIRIINKSGTIVYSTSIQGGIPAEWDGTSNSGEELEAGYYLFVVEHKNGEQTKGHVSILK